MKSATIIFTTLITIKQIFAQFNPCPEYFEYKLNGNKKYGIITIPGPSKGKTEIKAHIAILGGEIYDHNSGGLHLVKRLEDALYDGERGKDIQFRLSFPQSAQWPIITKIMLNHRDICIGPRVNNVWEWSYGKTLYNPKGATELSYIPNRRPNRPTNTNPPVTYERPPTVTRRPNITIPRRPDPPRTPPVTPKPTIPPSPPIIPKEDPPTGSNNDASWLAQLPFVGSCGRNVKTDVRFQTTHLIIGGKEIDKGEFPWMVAMFHYINRKPEYRCAGTLVSNEYVLTAAHCLVNQTRVYLELGHHDLSDSNEVYEPRFSLRLIRHPGYREGPNNDIALILIERVEFTNKIKPICLWGFGTRLDRFLVNGTITGWGRVENDGDFSNVPMKLRVRRVDQNTCKKSNQALEKIVTQNTFCAGGHNTGPCHGDSGSGFYHLNNNIWYLRGIISTSLGTNFVCYTQEYAVYADVAFYLDWLRTYLFP